MAERPKCPKCGLKMMLVVQPGGTGHRIYQCLDCARVDPIELPDAIGWISGELGKSKQRQPD